MVLFCQMDITGRTEDDPVAETLALNILRYISAWQPAPRREVIYAGDSAGRQHLESAGTSLNSYNGASLSAGQVLVVGPGGEQKLANDAATIAKWLKAGGNLLAIGLNEQQVNSFLPIKVRMKETEHIASYFEPFGSNSLLAGVGTADVHNRDPRKLSLVSAGVTIIGDGVLGRAEDFNVVFCQLVPWQFDYKKLYNVKRTFRRTSYLVTRLLANMGAVGQTPLLEHFGTPVDVSKVEKRWLKGLYMDTPEEWDDPYRFFRW
jgi:beta-galactosidase